MSKKEMPKCTTDCVDCKMNKFFVERKNMFPRNCFSTTGKIIINVELDIHITKENKFSMGNLQACDLIFQYMLNLKRDEKLQAIEQL